MLLESRCRLTRERRKRIFIIRLQNAIIQFTVRSSLYVSPYGPTYEFQNKHLWVMKATGLGITEFFLRIGAWLCTPNENHERIRNAQICSDKPKSDCLRLAYKVGDEKQSITYTENYHTPCFKNELSQY